MTDVDSSACRHCGLPVRTGAHFCCTGCALVDRLSARGDDARADPLLARILLASFLTMGVMCFAQLLYARAWREGALGANELASAEAIDGLFRLASLAFSAPVLLLLGWPLADAVVRLRRWLSADALVLSGVAAAWIVSVWNTLFDGGHVYFETATVVLVLVGVGRWLEVRARDRARRELCALLPDRVLPVARIEGDREVDVAPQSLRIGDRVRVRPGETIPVDGRVVDGRSFVDTSALSGESVPASIGLGDRVLAGATLVDGTLVVEAQAVGAGRVRDEIERLLAQALSSRPAAVRLADRVAAFLLPAVVAIAAATVLGRWADHGAQDALLAALSVLLIACPCALGIATPMAFSIALAAAWKRGILVRGGAVLERLACARRVFFDKTGTLTDGELTVADVHACAGFDVERAWSVAAALETGSEHPIARALRRAAAQRGTAPAASADFERIPGSGVRARIDGASWTLSRARDAEPGANASHATCVDLAREGDVVARFDLVARVLPEARATVTELARRRFDPRVLTGDGRGPAENLRALLDVPVEYDLLPHGKLARITAAGATGTIFVGDGLNDAAALAAADVGIAVCGASHASLEAADVQLVRARIDALPWLLDAARSAVRTARQNLVWAFAYNALGVWLAASGRLTPVSAALAMVVSSLAVLLNSSRLARELAFERAGHPSARANATGSTADDDALEPVASARILRGGV